MTTDALREVAALVGLILGILTLFGLVWKMSALATKLSLSIATLQVEVKEVQEMREHLQKLPLIERRLEQAEKFMSSFPRALREERDREMRLSKGDFK